LIRGDGEGPSTPCRIDEVKRVVEDRGRAIVVPPGNAIAEYGGRRRSGRGRKESKGEAGRRRKRREWGLS